MEADPIVAEIRQLRERRAARFGFDIPAIVRDAQERDATGDREIARRPPRRPFAPARSEAQPAPEQTNPREAAVAFMVKSGPHGPAVCRSKRTRQCARS
jgi:hypothetical protein